MIGGPCVEFEALSTLSAFDGFNSFDDIVPGCAACGIAGLDGGLSNLDAYALNALEQAIPRDLVVRLAIGIPTLTVGLVLSFALLDAIFPGREMIR